MIIFLSALLAKDIRSVVKIYRTLFNQGLIAISMEVVYEILLTLLQSTLYIEYDLI